MSEIFSLRCWTDCEQTSAKGGQLCGCMLELPKNIRKCLEQWIVRWRTQISWKVNYSTHSHLFLPQIKRGNEGKSMELDHLMEMFHQAVTFPCVIVCPPCFLGHTVLISICNFNLHRHLNSFQRDLDTHLQLVSQLEISVYLEMALVGSLTLTSLVCSPVWFQWSFLGKMPEF